VEVGFLVSSGGVLPTYRSGYRPRGCAATAFTGYVRLRYRGLTHNAPAPPVLTGIKRFREEFEAGYTAAAGELFPYAASSVFESAR